MYILKYIVHILSFIGGGSLTVGIINRSVPFIAGFVCVFVIICILEIYSYYLIRKEREEDKGYIRIPTFVY